MRIYIPDKDKIAKYEKEMEKNKAMHQAKPVQRSSKQSINKPNVPQGDINEEEKDQVANLPVSKPKKLPGGRRRSSLMKGFVNTLGNNAIKNLIDEPIFKDVGSMGAGKSFGELALLKTKPRAARIQCATDCEFACMCKADYKKVLAKIEERLANNMIDFLQSIPLFSTWSRNLLMKLLYKIEKKGFIKNQAVVREGEPIKEICIIKNGEFEVSSKMNNKKEFHLQLTEKLMGKNYMKKFLKPKKSHLSILGVGQMISEQDLLANNPNFEDSKVSSVTVVCSSLKGSVYYIKANEFLKAMKKDVTTWEIFESHCKRKVGESESRVAMMNNVLEKNPEEEKYGIDYPSLIFKDKDKTRTISRPKKIFGQKLNSTITDFKSEKLVPGLTSEPSEKRVAYERVDEFYGKLVCYNIFMIIV